jgi:bifunctional DNA-binding transcriptional regulator/antitoxin component of YhaV-PrlF toxin-antitoxin module
LEKTRVGVSYRTTVPEGVRKLLRLEKGDEIIWIQEGERIIVDRARKEIS